MSTRVKYKESNGILRTKEFLVGKDMLVGSINIDEKTFNIVSVATNTVVASGNATTLATLKKLLKTALITQGAVFDGEVRNRFTDDVVEDEFTEVDEAV